LPIYLRLPNKEAATILRALTLVFEDLPVTLRRSLTLDNGPENALHATLSAPLGMSVYFCHSYASSEKGQVENSNRDFRKFVPNGMCLSRIDDHLITTAESYRNTLPLKCLEDSLPHGNSLCRSSPLLRTD
jgi:IS30 family transposase